MTKNEKIKVLNVGRDMWMWIAGLPGFKLVPEIEISDLKSEYLTKLKIHISDDCAFCEIAEYEAHKNKQSFKCEKCLLRQLDNYYKCIDPNGLWMRIGFHIYSDHDKFRELCIEMAGMHYKAIELVKQERTENEAD